MDISGPFSNLKEWESYIKTKAIHHPYEDLFIIMNELVEQKMLNFINDKGSQIHILS